MLDWVKMLRRVALRGRMEFDSDRGGGTSSYLDDQYGELDFTYEFYPNKIVLSFQQIEPICICGHGFGSLECDCEFDAFGEVDAIVKVFTKKQALSLLQPSLF